MLSRRAFIARLGAAVAVAQTSGLAALAASATPVAAQTAPTNPFDALLAFVVPGTDAFSMAQDETDVEPGGVDAGVRDALMETLDLAADPPPPFPSTSVFVAYLLDQAAAGVNQAAGGFAGLSFDEKFGVFAFLEADPLTAPLALSLLALSANLAYSEAGVFDEATRTLTGRPLGWELTGYPGVSDGRDEFVGYHRNRKKATNA